MTVATQKSEFCRDVSVAQVRYVRGGVARNVAENMSLLGTSPFLISVVGEDVAGKYFETLGFGKGLCRSTHFLLNF